MCVNDLAHLGDEQLRRAMGGNLAKLIGVENTPLVTRSA
jgi:hypothetical protein